MGLSDIKLTDIDFQSVEECTQPRVLRRYIALLEEDGGYFHQLLHAARQKLASLTGCKTTNRATANGDVTSAAEITAARQDLLTWLRSIESSSEPTCSDESQPERKGYDVRSVNSDTEELEDVAGGAKKPVCTIGNPTDGKTRQRRKEEEPCQEGQQKEGEGIQKEKYFGRACKNKGEVEVEELNPVGGEKRHENPGGVGDTESDRLKRSGAEENAREELERGNDTGKELTEEGTSLNGIADGCSNQPDVRHADGTILHSSTRTTDLDKQIASMSCGEPARRLSGDKGDGRRGTEAKPLSLSLSKLALEKGNHGLQVDRVTVVETTETVHGNRETHPQSAPGQHHQSSQSHPHPLSREMRKICVELDEEEDTDECSEVMGSEED